jgi:hypothetical protein
VKKFKNSTYKNFYNKSKLIDGVSLKITFSKSRKNTKKPVLDNSIKLDVLEEVGVGDWVEYKVNVGCVSELLGLGLLGWLGALKQELKVLTIRSLIILSLMK